MKKPNPSWAMKKFRIRCVLFSDLKIPLVKITEGEQFFHGRARALSKGSSKDP